MLRHVDTIILVENIEISKSFYTKVMGLEILHDWDNMVIFKERFSIHKADALLPKNETEKLISGGKQGRGNVVVYFETDQLEKTYTAMLDNQVPIIHGIIKLPWQKIFRVFDPDGHIIEIGNPF